MTGLFFFRSCTLQSFSIQSTFIQGSVILQGAQKKSFIITGRVLLLDKTYAQMLLHVAYYFSIIFAFCIFSLNYKILQFDLRLGSNIAYKTIIIILDFNKKCYTMIDEGWFTTSQTMKGRL